MYASGPGLNNVDPGKSFLLLIIIFFGTFHIMSSQTYSIDFSISPDCWGYETFWTLYDSNGTLIDEVPENTYPGEWANGSGPFTETYDLSNGLCYTFTLSDSYGDGMTGSDYGSCDVDGAFSFTTSSGDILAELSDPDFGSSQIFDFCVTGGCRDAQALNFDSSANIDDGSCTYVAPSYVDLSWELVASNSVGAMNTYRVYANFTNPLDQVVTCYGQDVSPLSISTTTSFYQDADGGFTSNSIDPSMFTSVPNLEFDSWVTIGAEYGLNGVSSINDNSIPFESGGSLNINDLDGGAWYVLADSEPAAFPDGMGRVLLTQLTTDGVVDLTFNLQYRAQDGSEPAVSGEFLTFPSLINGCMDTTASNFDSTANTDDGTCTFAPPIAGFTSDVGSSQCGVATVDFTNTSVSGTTYSWTFQNGSPSASTNENPSVDFPSGGTFDVELTTTNNSGTSTSAAQVVVAEGEEGSWITLVISPDCWGSELGWTLSDGDGNEIKHVDSGTYIDEFPEFLIDIREDFCLVDDCYTIEIEDSYGDGFDGDQYWSCDADGTFWFEDSNGNVFGQFSDDPDFGTSHSDVECINYMFTWKGGFDSDWNNISNWLDNAVPSATDNVQISQISYPPSLDATALINNLLINAGSSIEFTNSSGILKVKGNIVNNGVLDVDAGKIVMNGDKTQYIKGTITPTFYQLKMNTTDSIRLLTDVEFLGPLLAQKGTFDFNGNDVVLVSDADNTGSIGEIKNNAEIVGDTITIHRYFPAASGSWRMLSTPIIDATFEQWNDDIPTTGFAGSDYPTYPSASDPWSNIKYYDETLTAGQAAYLDSGFNSVADISDTIGNARGYFVYFVPSPTTIDVTGTWRKYDQDYTLDFSESNSDPFNDGWNLVANPYPSAIDWDDAVGWSRTDLNEAVYAFDPINGQYSSYVNGVSIGSLNGIIASTQAFWVKSESGSPSMTLKESSKVNSTGVHMRTEDMNTQTVIRLKLQGGDKYDETVIGFHSLAQAGFDPEYDAYKFYAPSATLPNLASVAEATEDADNEMGINMIQAPEADVTIDLIVKKGQYTDMVLSNVMIDTYDANICLVLEDKELETFVPFGEGESYPFAMGEESVEERFALHVSAPLNGEGTNETCPDVNDGTATVQGFGEVPWSFTWKNGEGDIIQEHTDMSTADSMANLAPGFYEVIVENTSTQCQTATKVIEIGDAFDEHLEALVEQQTCLGAEEGVIEIDLDDDYFWNLTLLDDNDELIATIDGQQGDTTFTNLPPGIYQIAGISSCGNSLSANDLDVIDPQSVVAGFESDSDTINLYEGGSLTLYNNSSNALNFIWNFGEGAIDSLNIDGQHVFTEIGVYPVSLTAYNMSCTDIKFKNIIVVDLTPEEEEELDNNSNSLTTQVAGIDLVDWDSKVDVKQGPLNLTVKSDTEIKQEVIFRIYNSAGQLVLEEKQDYFDSAVNLSIGNLAQGAFHLTVITQGMQIKSEKFIKN
ncbi:MAG: PKD repeat protein [Flavobacteriales bacterium]|jgi:PKD repeat protein